MHACVCKHLDRRARARLHRAEYRTLRVPWPPWIVLPNASHTPTRTENATSLSCMPASADSVSQIRALGGDEMIDPELATFASNEQFWQRRASGASGSAGPHVEVVRALLKSSWMEPNATDRCARRRARERSAMRAFGFGCAHRLGRSQRWPETSGCAGRLRRACRTAALRLGRASRA